MIPRLLKVQLNNFALFVVVFFSVVCNQELPSYRLFIFHGFLQLYMIPEIRTGILGVEMGPMEAEDEQLDAEDKPDKDVI